MTVDPRAAGFCPDKLDRLSTHLQDRYLTPKKIAGCQILVKRRGIKAFDASLGQMDMARGKPMSADTIFRIYSMTKPVTSIALMMLFGKGDFN